MRQGTTAQHGIEQHSTEPGRSHLQRHVPQMGCIGRYGQQVLKVVHTAPHHSAHGHAHLSTTAAAAGSAAPLLAASNASASHTAAANSWLNSARGLRVSR